MTGQANDSDRLPWLEPYREPGAAPRRAARPPRLKAVEPADKRQADPLPPRDMPSRQGGVPLAGWLAAGVTIVALAAGGGYWAGHRSAPDPAAPAAPTVTIPVAMVDPIPMPEVETPQAAAVPAVTRPSAPKPRATTPRPVRKARPDARTAKVADVPPPRPDSAPPPPKVMAFRQNRPSAGPPGTVIDLGRYWSPMLAARAYRTTLSGYPDLIRLKKVVAPEPVVYGEPRLYTLELGAGSAGEARRMCGMLKKIGRPCTVR